MSQTNEKNQSVQMDDEAEIDLLELFYYLRKRLVWLELAFIIGGIICIIGQILIDKTKLTPARILVVFVTLGAVLGGLGIYKHIIEKTNIIVI